MAPGEKASSKQRVKSNKQPKKKEDFSKLNKKEENQIECVSRLLM